MRDLIVYPCNSPLRGVVRVPSDKSIGHRAVMLAALSEGTSTIRRFSFGEDNVSTLKAFEAMGVAHEIVTPVTESTAAKGGVIQVHGNGLFGLKAPRDGHPLDCGNSGTTMRLLAGLLSAQRFRSVLTGDASLSKRPMRRVLEPLRARGALCKGKAHPTRDDETAPIEINALPNGQYLSESLLSLKIASAQVKSAMLFSGLYAHGVTEVHEPTLSRDHTERMMLQCGIPIRAEGTVSVLDPAGWNGQISPFDISIPGDISAAVFLLVAAQIVPESVIRIVETGTNPTRTGALDIIRDMGGMIHVEAKGEQGGEPIANIEAASVEKQVLCASPIGGELIPRAIDEIPILSALCAFAQGTSFIRDAQELRVKESDRIATMVHVLRSFGVLVDELPDGMKIQGERARTLKATHVDSKGDHRIAMTAAILALRGDGPTHIHDVECVATSFPGFARTLRDLGAHVEEV